MEKPLIVFQIKSKIPVIRRCTVCSFHGDISLKEVLFAFETKRFGCYFYCSSCVEKASNTHVLGALKFEEGKLDKSLTVEEKVWNLIEEFPDENVVDLVRFYNRKYNEDMMLSQMKNHLSTLRKEGIISRKRRGRTDFYHFFTKALDTPKAA